MKKAALFASVFLFFLLFTGVSVHATESSRSTLTSASQSALDRRHELIAEEKEKVQGKVEDLRAKIASREAEFKNKLALFKDKVKAQIVSKINDLLNTVNKNRTTEMSRNLDRMSDILTKLKQRAATASASPKLASSSAESSKSGKPTVSVSEALTNAQTAIDKAKTAVSTQAAKDYTIHISTESAVKSDAKAQREQLLTDLKATHQLVVDAKQTLANAFKAVAIGLGGVKNGQ